MAQTNIFTLLQIHNDNRHHDNNNSTRRMNRNDVICKSTAPPPNDGVTVWIVSQTFLLLLVLIPWVTRGVSPPPPPPPPPPAPFFPFLTTVSGGWCALWWIHLCAGLLKTRGPQLSLSGFWPPHLYQRVMTLSQLFPVRPFPPAGRTRRRILPSRRPWCDPPLASFYLPKTV